MPRDITVTFKDGTSHTYRDAPDNLTPDIAEERAVKDFKKPVASLSGAKVSAAPKPSIGGDFVRPIKDAATRLVDDFTAVGEKARTRALNKTPIKASDILDIGPGPGLVGNLFNLAVSPIQGATEVFTRPAARALVGSGLPVYDVPSVLEGFGKYNPRRIYGQEAEDSVTGDINMALSAGKPGRVTRPRAGPAMGAGANTGARETRGMAEAEDALREVGINIRTVSTATMDRIRMQVRQGRNAREAALGIVANNELPVPLPMTRGQRTGQPGQQLAENLMLRGARGSAASRQMRGFVEEQQQSLRGNVDAIAANVTRGVPPERGAGVAGASERLNTMYDRADAGVNRAYEAARASTGDAILPPGERATASSRVREAVADFDEIDVAPVFRAIDRIGDGNAITARNLFAERSRFVALQKGNDRTAVAAGRAKRALDGYIDEALDRNLFSGDAAAVNLWREAISQRRDFGRQFEAGDLIQKLTQRVNRGGQMQTNLIDPGDAANYVLGRSDMGFVGKQNLNRDLERLRSVLGESSGEWNALRGEIFQRVASQGESGVEFGQRQFSGVKFQKAWQDFSRKDPRMASALFSEQERAQIDRFASLAARVTNPVKGGDNPSNTAVAAMRLLGNLRFLRGLPFVKEFATEVEAQVSLGAARAATSPRYARAPMTAPDLSGPARALSSVSRPAAAAVVAGNLPQPPENGRTAQAER